jgi:glycosyltransferase involved in cell wall biosynthesis
MIAYFVYNLDSYSGAAQQALLLAKHIKIDILFFNHNNKRFRKYKYNKFIEIIDLPQNIILQMFIILFFTFKHKIKIFHFHGLFKVGMFLGTILKRKIILKTTLLGDDDFDKFVSRRGRKIRYVLIKHVDKNIVLSKKLKEINLKYVDSSKIKLIPNGVLLAENCPRLEEKEDAFCFVGLICERKKTYESIKYFIDNYLNESVEYKMYIIGPYKDIKNNPEFTEEYVQRCFDLVKKHNLENRIIFTGNIKKEKVLNILRKSKALLFFSGREGMPNAVLEAMANNCVPIISDIGGVAKELFEHQKHGFILGDGYEKVQISDIEFLIRNKLPYLLAKNKYDIKIIAKRYVELYGELCKIKLH